MESVQAAGAAALEALRVHGGLRDRALRTFVVSEVASATHRLQVEMDVDAPFWSGVARLKLRLSGVTRLCLDLEPQGSPLFLVTRYKVFLPDTGCYLSLDPWDEFSTVPDERDGFLIEAESLEIEIIMQTDRRRPPSR